MKVLLEGTRIGPKVIDIDTLRPIVKMPVYSREPIRYEDAPSRCSPTLEIDVFERTNELDPESALPIYRLKA